MKNISTKELNKVSKEYIMEVIDNEYNHEEY